MTRKGQSITLSLLATDKAKLEQLAAEFGMTWGEKPNISKLIKAIARSELWLAPNHDWTAGRIEVLETAWRILVETEHHFEAQEIAQLLCERSEINIPLRHKLQAFLDSPQTQWRQQLEQYIRRHQPFRLMYQDPQERIWRFTILHARIQLIEKSQYLLCRCEETEGNRDLPELGHNRTLRLDRIQDAAIAPLNKRWLSAPDRIAVTFCLYGGLAFAYRPDPEDEASTLEGDPPIRRVVRQVFSTFWFLRDIAPYYADCEIIAPASVRQRHQEHIARLSQLYGDRPNPTP